MSDRAAAAARRAHLRLLRGAAARQRLCRRARADHRVPRRDRTARPARASRTSGRPALATLAPPPEAARRLRQAVRIHFLGSEEIRACEDGEDDETVRLQEEGRGDEEPPLADEANESGRHATRAEALVERRFCPGADRATRCAGWRAKPRRACRGGAAIAACARGADPLPIFAEPCANPYATTAR